MSRVPSVERLERADRESARPSTAIGSRTCRRLSVFIPVLNLVWILASAGFVLGQVDRENVREETGESVRKTGDKIGPGVRETLDSGGSVRVIVALETPASLKGPARSRFNEIRRDVENTQNAVLGALGPSEHSMRRRYRMVPAFAAAIHSQAALDKLAGHPFVVRIGLDERMSAHLAESVPLIRADSMHTHGYTGEGVVAAILDTGIDTDHPDLSDDLIQEECFLSDMECPNGLDRQSGPGAAEDGDGHGTHVAGTITSAGIFSSIGVAPDAQIVAIKVLDDSGSGWASDIIAGLDWILDNRPDVDLINMSLGSGYHETECDLANAVTTGFSVVINTLRAVGVTTFASSGNDYSGAIMGSPACVSGTVSVGATDDADNVASFSNSNAYTDLLAPGVDIIADVPGGTIASKSGTSMASPHAVGCAALQLEAGRATTPGSLEAWLKATGVPVVDGRNGRTFARIDCFAEPTFPLSGPANDDLADAVPVAPLPYAASGSTVNAGFEPSEAFGSCSSDHGNSVWWTFTAPESRRYEVNTNGSSINTGLSVWTGSDHPLTETACDDDSGVLTTSRLRFDAEAGREYSIRVIGLAGKEGSVVVRVLIPTLPVNDDLADAIVLGELPSTVYGANIGASQEPSERLASCAADAGTAVWWRYTAAETGSLYLNTDGSNFNTVLGIWTGSNHPLNELACDNDSGPGSLSWLSFDANAGESYYIRVSGYGGAEGEIVLNTTTLPACLAQTEIPIQECQALVDFFDSTNQLGWKNNDGWNASHHPCSWYGVSCTDGRVSGLTLNKNFLAGPIPESIGNLTAVTMLEFSGLDPSSIFATPANFLYGSLPASIGNLTNLTYLGLDWNSLNGAIPESIGNLSSLEHLDLYHNYVTEPLPESIGNLSNLTYLNLASNGIGGTLPGSIGGMSSLTSLIPYWNAIEGSIPESIGNLSNLTHLDLLHNQLTGTIPESIGNLINLTRLNLSYNSLTGPVPPSFGQLYNLEDLDLRANNLRGTVPLPVARIGTWARCRLSVNADLCIPNILDYQALAPEGYVCGLPLHPSCDPIVHAEAKVFLEGPYSNGAMRADTMFTDHCPGAQPYSDPIFDGTALEYDEPDVSTSPPDSIMDWVLVGLRSDVGPESLIPESIRAAFLRTNGEIVDTTGGILAFPGVAPGAYRIVVRHRNHASVMSADTLDLSDGIGSWDFTTAISQAYSAGGLPMKQLRDGRFGMFACDANVDGQVTAPDFNLWIEKTTSGATGYQQADCDLDGQVTAPDFNLWIANTTAGASSQVPD